MTRHDSITIPHTAILAHELRHVMPILRRATDRMQTIPILNTIRLTAQTGQDTARLTATNLDMEITATISASTHTPLDACFPANVLRSIASDDIETLDLSITDDRWSIVAGDMRGTMRLLCPAVDFPEMRTKSEAEIEGTDPLMIPEATLRRLFAQGRHCISSEETRYYLNGTYLHPHPTEGTLRTTTTDGHRMAVVDSDVPWPKGWPAQIVPTRAVDTLIALCQPGGNTDIALKLAKHHLVAHRDGLPHAITLTTKLIDGTYPDYTRAMPTAEAANRATLSLTALRRLNRMAQAICPSQCRALTLDPANGEMRIATPEGMVTAPLQGKAEQPISVNARYLLEQARATPEFRVRWGENMSPARIEPGHEVEAPGASATYVIMPMRA